MTNRHITYIEFILSNNKYSKGVKSNTNYNNLNYNIIALATNNFKDNNNYSSRKVSVNNYLSLLSTN